MEKDRNEFLARNIKILLLIPSDKPGINNYRYPLALYTMLNILETGRADNWKECADKYEEQVHRWKLEMNSMEYLTLQKQTLEAAKDAKFYSTMSAIGNIRF